LIALKTGEIRLYADKNLITTIECDLGVIGMKFGIFGREEGSLVINLSSGALLAKILGR
jgi:Bardet-Biedl syndrome 1 protein